MGGYLGREVGGEEREEDVEEKNIRRETSPFKTREERERLVLGERQSS